MNYLIRPFARRVQDATKLNWKPKIPFETVLNNKEFLNSIGIKHFPIDQSFESNTPIDILNQEGRYLGSKSLAEAKTLAEQHTLDLILLDTEPPLLKLDNFKQTILKKVRIAQSKSIRKNIKEDFRTVSIRNTIKSHDLELKLQKIEDFIKAYENVIIEVPAEIESRTAYDRAKILTKDIQKIFIQKFPDGTCEIEKDNDKIRVFFCPSEKRDEILEALSSNIGLFNEAEMKTEFKKIRNKLKRYKTTYHPDAEERRAAEEKFLNTLTSESD